ncbi:MAG: protein-glutamate O-methyltransferase CheR [Actinomycetota bacterium]|nr:protein-glutamate O-methyltransferase CheR [Actinomycetota bacterium]
MIAAVPDPDPQEEEGSELELIEIELLLEAVHRRYAFDFRDYAPAVLRRRLWRRAQAEGVRTLSGLQERVLHDPAAMERLLLDLSVTTTSMFRDPGFWLAFREKVVPILRTYPFVRIWSAGCSTGEETYSIAIVLQEEGLLDRSRIYATDINAAVLARARNGMFPLARMREANANYLRAGGARAFSDYYISGYDHARFCRPLCDNVVWAQHNLVSDASFNEFHVILCRNVLIYFGKPLQDRVHALLHESLAPFGFLALGSRETLRFAARETDYAPVVEAERLYRRVA